MFSGEQRPKNKGNTGNFGEQGTYKIKFVFGEQGHFFQGNRYAPWEGPPQWVAKDLKLSSCEQRRF